MLTKIKLFYQIRKFYNIFGDEVGHNFITKLSDVTTDNLYDVLFDINEALSEYRGYEDLPLYVWLNKLQKQIERRYN